MSPSSHSAPTQNTASPRQTPDPATENQPASGSAWVVFLAFLRLGLTSFGGPVAHFGYFRDEFVTRRNWLSHRNYADLMALCQFLPGPARSQTGMRSEEHTAELQSLMHITYPVLCLKKNTNTTELHNMH